MKKFVDLFWITFGESYEYTMAEIIAAKSAAIQRLSGSRSGKRDKHFNEIYSHFF